MQPFSLRWIIWLLLSLVAILVIATIMRVLRRRFLRAFRRDEEPRIICCKCGYDLRGLDVPRCPECGALRGFNVPLDELGLTEEEIRAGVEARRSRHKGTPGESPAGTE